MPSYSSSAEALAQSPCIRLVSGDARPEHDRVFQQTLWKKGGRRSDSNQTDGPGQRNRHGEAGFPRSAHAPHVRRLLWPDYAGLHLLGGLERSFHEPPSSDVRRRQGRRCASLPPHTPTVRLARGRVLAVRAHLLRGCDPRSLKESRVIGLVPEMPRYDVPRNVRSALASSRTQRRVSSRDDLHQTLPVRTPHETQPPPRMHLPVRRAHHRSRRGASRPPSVAEVGFYSPR